MKHKWLTPLIILLLLVIFPGISWIYLKKGFDYQKGNFASMQPIGLLPADSLSRLDSCFNSFTLGQVTLLVVGKPENIHTIDSLAIKLGRQFQSTQKFKFIAWYTDHPLPATAHFSVCQISTLGLDYLRSHFAASPAFVSGQELMITDARLQVRKYYALHDLKDLKELVTHIALLLPKEEAR